jgi:hypothetical protein
VTHLADPHQCLYLSTSYLFFGSTQLAGACFWTESQ